MAARPQNPQGFSTTPVFWGGTIKGHAKKTMKESDLIDSETGKRLAALSRISVGDYIAFFTHKNPEFHFYEKINNTTFKKEDVDSLEHASVELVFVISNVDTYIELVEDHNSWFDLIPDAESAFDIIGGGELVTFEHNNLQTTFVYDGEESGEVVGKVQLPGGTKKTHQRCMCKTLKGVQCKRSPSSGSKYCFQHQKCAHKV